ncbi:MAG: hypothetical protein GWO22_14345, partial [Actinobacteria bacterium]|nr:hypothetical protein [Actinomycetota bacterium]
LRFVQAAIEHEIVSPAELRDRLALTALDESQHERIDHWLTKAALRAPSAT